MLNTAHPKFALGHCIVVGARSEFPDCAVWKLTDQLARDILDRRVVSRAQAR
jgi:hypothetical protein